MERTLAVLVGVWLLLLAHPYAVAAPDSAAPTTVGIELARNAPSILASIAAIVSTIFGFLAWRRSSSNTSDIEKVHKLVNGKSGIQEAKLDATLGELAALKQEIAARPGSTSEERVRAAVATEGRQRDATIAAAAAPKETAP